MATIYKIYSPSYKKYWNGRTSTQLKWCLSSTGNQYVSRSSAEKSLQRFLIHVNYYYKNIELYQDWIIEEIEITEKKLKTFYLDHIKTNALIYNKLRKIDKRAADFYLHLRKNNTNDLVEYILVLQGEYEKYCSRTEIIAARKILRDLGLPTRSFRERDGVFGFYNSDQALKAKLALNGTFINLQNIKNEVDLNGVKT